ncbi:MarR family transcriptional regulator [Silvanigrella paludirubra]|jgi:DNA-binding HxlR family transcriptional regulator|uniref:MarR family transcriptional regulator n=1 Tax=Silvanigrella paludirubra TaxID=2499159 RepID=A0A6N6VY79_9BACT|nr:helix-turn-helix domain-containing protein [Silvanigrella paludirubra]KAB8039842.1 MarR family transcriptional regulator [Silvanigrella paludirubra]
MIKPKKNIEIEGASVECALDAICGKWKGVIIYNLLKFEVLRFGELQKNLKNKITQRMLTIQLRDLEEQGILSRNIYPTIPPKVEYFLTEKGKTLAVIIQNLNDWGSTYY